MKNNHSFSNLLLSPLDLLINYIREKLEIKKCYNFYGYNYNIECDKIQDYKFACICFNNYGDMRKCISAIQEFHKNNFERSREGKIAYEFGKNKQPKIISIDLSDIINHNQHLKEDITLPIIKDNPNIKCPNAVCITNTSNKSTEINFIKYDKKMMSYMYICQDCNQKWTNR